jgi:hypothetical protein
MRTASGPGGTIQIEIEGVGVNWWRRRTAEGVPVFQHGGSWQGQYSGFFFVPQRQFAMTMLTNSTGGTNLLHDLFFTDRVLSEFAGLHDPPATPGKRPDDALAAYEGRYRALIIPPTERLEDFDGTALEPRDIFVEADFDVTAENGGLKAVSEDMTLTLAFYDGEKVLATNQDGQVHRSDFIRAEDGRVSWFRDGGRLFGRTG